MRAGATCRCRIPSSTVWALKKAAARAHHWFPSCWCYIHIDASGHRNVATLLPRWSKVCGSSWQTFQALDCLLPEQVKDVRRLAGHSQGMAGMRHSQPKKLDPNFLSNAEQLREHVHTTTAPMTLNHERRGGTLYDACWSLSGLSKPDL